MQNSTYEEDTSSVESFPVALIVGVFNRHVTLPNGRGSDTGPSVTGRPLGPAANVRRAATVRER